MRYFRIICKKCNRGARAYHEYEQKEILEDEDKCMEDWWILECKNCKKRERVC